MVFFCEHIPSYVGRGCIIFSQLFFTKKHYLCHQSCLLANFLGYRLVVDYAL